MNSRLRWRSLTRAWTLPVSRSMPASKLTVPLRLYSADAPRATPRAGPRSRKSGRGAPEDAISRQGSECSGSWGWLRITATQPNQNFGKPKTAVKPSSEPCHIFISDRQFNRLPPCCHDLQPCSCESQARVQALMDRVDHVNPAEMIGSKESMN
jgi:hypothetical protein